MRDRIRTLEGLQKMALASAREAEHAKQDFLIARTGELGARIVLLGCELALDVLEERTGPAGLLVKTLYSQSQKLLIAYFGTLDTQKALEISTEAKLSAVKHHLGKKHKGTKAIEMVERLYKLSSTFNEFANFAKGRHSASGLDGARKTAMNLHSRLARQIEEFKVELNRCGYPVVQKRSKGHR